MPRLRTKLIAFLGLFLAPLPTADAFGPTPNPVQHSAESRLMAEFARFATLTDGTVGIAVRDLGTGETLAYNGDTLFPMASTYKLAVAAKILSLLDAGSLSLDEPLMRLGRPLPVRTLIDMSLTLSDNEATDALVARAGGPQAVNDWVRAAGIKGLRVDSNTRDLLARAKVVGTGYGDEAALESGLSAAQRDARDMPNLGFAADPRDTATPRAMDDLLAAIRLGRVLRPQTTALMLSIMERCKTGKARLRAMLPPGTRIAHKTGTLNGLGNDAGIVTLPDGRMFVISVFVMKDHMGHELRDRIMAEAARAAYDYFLFAPDRHTA
ncbi:beta-lactamase [Sphingobium sp. TA15]|uniref:Beta-lactamase n=3 Tax=Sphingobium indicum TaxID=332055 RepID=D4Z5U0_SPHIU|nr:serine hydrolase [Sphingobium indicum]KEY98366.1 beta-lactamase [Sphingomonas sp. BHC-A]BDD67359.1 beta-lactamase [Sphingobium sp. TA15]APL95335.1 serine hydrolase [Sphingobium indicum B90A]NYI22436.1 beta-lactamase class A [Sphingobium indicum]RYM02568.1 serine hydrolase [Sphingobium indicum]